MKKIIRRRCSGVKISRKYWGSGPRITGVSGYGEKRIRSTSHHYEGGGVCIRDDAEGNDDEGRVLVSQVRTRRGIKKRRTARLDFRVSSGKRKSMVYDDGFRHKHLVSQDFSRCIIRSDGFECGISFGERENRNSGLSCVSEKEGVGGREQAQSLCVNSLVPAEEEAVSDMGKRRRRRRKKKKKKYKETEKPEYVIPEETHDRQVSREELQVEDEDDELVIKEVQNPSSRNQINRCCSERVHCEVSVKRRRRRRRRRKRKHKETEKRENVVPEEGHDRQVSRKGIEVEDEDDELVIKENRKPPTMNQGKRCASEFADCDVPVKRKRRRNKKQSYKETETHEYVMSREELQVEDEDDELVIKENQNPPTMNQRKCASEFAHCEVSVKRRRRKKKKYKETERHEYLVPEEGHDRQVSRKELEVEDEDDEFVIKESQNPPSMNQRKRCASEFANCEVSVKRRRRRKKKYKETEKHEYVVREETHDRQVSREELEVEDEDDELVIEKNQNPPIMDRGKRCASEFAHCEVSVQRKRGVGGVERFRRGDIVWANSSDEEWWPGLVFKVTRMKVLASIFGQDRVCWISVFQVLPFEENYVEKSKNAGGQLKVAIGKALEELGKRAALGLICLCEGLIKFNENEKSAVVDVPGYSDSSHYTLEQILKARMEFRPLEVLDFLQKAAVSFFSDESDTVVANRAIAQAKGYRRFVSITPDWIYRETMRLAEVEHADEPDKGSWESEQPASNLADNEVCDRVHRSSSSLLVEMATKEVEQMDVAETEDGRGDEGKKDNLMMVERKEGETEFQRSHLQNSNALLNLEESHEKIRNKTLLQEEIKAIEGCKLDLNFCVTNEMDFGSFCSGDEYGLQISETPKCIDVGVETNAGDGKTLSDLRIKNVSSRANECRINNEEHVSVKTSLPSLIETLKHLHRLALDPLYDSDDVAFVFKALLRYRDVTFLNIANLKSSGVTLYSHCEYSNSADRKFSVSPSYVADSRNCNTILHDFKKDSFGISSTVGGREILKYSSSSRAPNGDMFSSSCKTNLASQECSTVETKMPSLHDTLTDLRCLALDPFSRAVCAAFVSEAFLRYRAVTFLNIANLRFSGGTLNRYLESGKNATIDASNLSLAIEQGNVTIGDCHARKDVCGLDAIPHQRDKVKGVPGSAVFDDATVRISEQNTVIFNAVDELILDLDVKDNPSVEASEPSLPETLTHLLCLALDPFYVPENVAFVCKAFLRYRAVSYSFSIFPSSNMLSRPCHLMTALSSQECGSVGTKMPPLLDTLKHLRCLAMDPLSGAVSAAFVSKAFLRYRAVTFLNITNIKSLDGTLNNHLKSGEVATRETSTSLSSVLGHGNGTASGYHAKKGIDVRAIAHENDEGVPSSAVSDGAMLSSISEGETNISSNAVNNLRSTVHDDLSSAANMPSPCETLTHKHYLASDPLFDLQNTASLCKASLRYRPASSSFSNDPIPDSGMLSRSSQHITTLPSQKCISVDTKMPSLLDTLAHLRSLALDPFSEAVSAAYISSAFLRYRAVTFLNVTNLKFSEDTLNHYVKSSENAIRETRKVLPSATKQRNGTAGDFDAKKDTFEVGAIPHERDRVKVVPCSVFPDAAMLTRTFEQENNTTSNAVNKPILNVQGGLSVQANVSSLSERLKHLHCLALDIFYDPENVAFACEAFLRFRAVSFKFKSLRNTYNHRHTLPKNAAKEIGTVTSTSISISEDDSSIVYHGKENFGTGGVLKKTEIRKLSSSAVSEKDQHSCRTQQTQNPVSLVKHVEEPSFSSESSTTSNKLQISTSNAVTLGKVASDRSFRLGMQGSEGLLVSRDDDRAEDVTNADLAGEKNCKSLSLPEQISGLSVAESCEKRGTSLFSPGVVPSCGNSSVGLFSNTKTHKLLDEVTRDESLTVDRGDANSNGGLALITSAKQHGSGLISQTQYLDSSLATASIGEIFMFLRCLACDVSYGGNHVNFVKQAFLRYRIASHHKNSVKYRPGLCNRLEHSDSGSLLKKSWPSYITAAAVPGDRQNAATDRIPDVSMTIDNKDASSDGGLPIQMATNQHHLDDAPEICNSVSADQGQLCRSSVTTLLGEMYLLLRCLACDPFFGGEHSSVKRAFLRYRVASYEKIYRFSSVECKNGMSRNHENLVSQSLSKTWPNSRGIRNGVLDDSYKERNVAPKSDIRSGDQCFSNPTSANPQTNGSGCAQNVKVMSETASHIDLGKCSGNNFLRKRKSDEVSAAGPLQKLKKLCGAVLPNNWYASPLKRDGLSRRVNDVLVLARNSTESTKIERFASSPENHDVDSYLHMKFPKNCELPSQDQLMKTFRRFGSIDCSKTKVFFYTGSGQVCFQRRADAEAAFNFAKGNVLFRQANIKFWISSLEKSMQSVQRNNCTDSVRKPKCAQSGNDDQNRHIDEQGLKDYDHINGVEPLPVSNVRSCLRKLSRPGDGDRSISSKVTFSLDSQSYSPEEAGTCLLEQLPKREKTDTQVPSGEETMMVW
ncbi:unnamed protein product [Victoria cruziana]